MSDWSALIQSADLTPALQKIQAYNQAAEAFPIKIRNVQSETAAHNASAEQALAHAAYYRGQTKKAEADAAASAAMQKDLDAVLGGGGTTVRDSGLDNADQVPMTAGPATPQMTPSGMTRMAGILQLKHGLLDKAGKSFAEASLIDARDASVASRKATAAKEAFNLGQKKMSFAMGVAQMAKDQESLDAAVEMYPMLLKMNGMPPEDHPLKGAAYSPELVQGMSKALMTAHERAATNLREQELRLREQQVKSTVQRNNASIGLAAARRNLTNQRLEDLRKGGGPNSEEAQAAKAEKTRLDNELKRLQAAKLRQDRALQGTVPSLAIPMTKDLVADKNKRIVGKLYRNAKGVIAPWTSQGWGNAVNKAPAASPTAGGATESSGESEGDSDLNEQE